MAPTALTGWSRGSQILRVVREDGGKPISNRQRVARDSAIIGEIKPVCGEPVRMDEEALNNAVQCADAGRKLGNDAGVRGGIGHWVWSTHLFMFCMILFLPLVAPAWRRICLNRAPDAKFSCVSANSGESAAGRMTNFISEPVVACVAAMLAMPKHCHFQE